MPVFAVIIIQYRKAFKAWGIRQLALLGKISSKTMGIKTFFAIVFTRIKDILCNACKNIFHIIGRHKTEYVLFTLLSVWLLYIYGSNEIIQYGYTVSDLPVHNYWINEMSKNNIFAAGVYPFGFHCIIYYIHTVFHIDTLCNSAAVFRGADLLSASGFVYLYPLHMPFFLCRLWWTVFISGSIIIPRQLYDPFYQRTAAGIRHAVYPAVYLLFIRIFKDKERKCRKMDYLYRFSGSMCVFQHDDCRPFYDTMIAGLFCAAIVIGFCVRFSGRAIFPADGAVLLAVVIGVLPMFTAALCGKPMQGSIGWGINILTGRSSSGTNQNQDSNENKANTSSSGSSQIALPDTTKEEVTPEPENLAQDIDTEPVLTPSVSTLEKRHIFAAFLPDLIK